MPQLSGPLTELGDINRIEIIQLRASRFISKNFNRIASVTAMLNHLNWGTLEQSQAPHVL